MSSNIKVEARLDLHGYTLAAAHRAVLRFVEQAHHRQFRCIEIITGRGDPARGTGALRREVPLWLEVPPLRNFVLSLSWPVTGRGGVLRVMLRRSKIRN